MPIRGAGSLIYRPARIPPATIVKMAALQDAFPGSVLNGALWVSYGNVTVGSGTLTLTDVASSTAGTAGIQSLARYDLRMVLADLSRGGGAAAA